jgi:hypothetical protein
MYTRLTALAALSLTAAALFAGCGTSKPAYCTQVSDFHNSVSALEKQEISITNASSVLSAVDNVGTSAKALATALKGEFATQISAIEDSLSAVAKSLGEATGSLSAAKQALVGIPAQIDTLKQAASEIQQVTKSKCE